MDADVINRIDNTVPEDRRGWTELAERTGFSRLGLALFTLLLVKHPPAEPGALKREPLKAAERGR